MRKRMVSFSEKLRASLSGGSHSKLGFVPACYPPPPTAKCTPKGVLPGITTLPQSVPNSSAQRNRKKKSGASYMRRQQMRAQPAASTSQPTLEDSAARSSPPLPPPGAAHAAPATPPPPAHAFHFGNDDVTYVTTKTVEDLTGRLTFLNGVEELGCRRSWRSPEYCMHRREGRRRGAAASLGGEDLVELEQQRRRVALGRGRRGLRAHHRVPQAVPACGPHGSVAGRA